MQTLLPLTVLSVPQSLSHAVRKSLVAMVSLTAVTGLIACADSTGETPSPEATPAGISCNDDVCVLSGDILDNVTLTNDKVWLLRGGVFIGDDDSDRIFCGYRRVRVALT